MILAGDVFAKRSNPPQPNTAVDGYGFAGPARGRAGDAPDPRARGGRVFPFDGAVVPQRPRLRVLDRRGLAQSRVDTVILEEDVTVEDGHIAFHGP